MRFQIDVHLDYTTPSPCALLLQIEALSDATQTVEAETLSIAGHPILNRQSGDGGIGQRIWLDAPTVFTCDYTAIVSVDRPRFEMSSLTRAALTAMPDHATSYLMASRYCHPEQFADFTNSTLSHLAGGAFVAAAADWICSHFTYDPLASHAGTTAFETFQARKGVCRDYAHVLIAMARSRGIPARLVSCYAPDVTPQDFHAVAEVYLDGAWQLVDATRMAAPDEIARIGVGRDAADVSFMTSYGWMTFKNQSVRVKRL